MTNEDLILWLNQQNVWVIDAVKTFYSKGEFSNDDINRFAEECLNEAYGTKKTIELGNINLLHKNDRECFAIESIENIEGVNALASGKKLSFEPDGITVIYGENGVGKSGYIRIIKQLADAKYKEELKQNVYKNSRKNNQSCDVCVRVDGIESELKCDLNIAGEHSVFRDIDIFDTQISNAYICNENEASYEPWIFAMFREIAHAATMVKNELERQIHELDSFELHVPPEYADTSFGKMIQSIVAETVIDNRLFAWCECDEETLSQKEKEANIDATNNRIGSLSNEIYQLKSIQSYFLKFEKYYSEENIKNIQAAKAEWQKCAQEQLAAQIVFRDEASELEKDSISNSAWKALWRDAYQYYETLLKSKGIVRYTEEKGVCPLCGQELINPNVVQRMKRLDEYLNGKVSQRVNKSKTEYFDLLKQFPDVWSYEQLSVMLDACDVGVEKDNILCLSEQLIIHSNRISKDEVDSIDLSGINISLVIDEIGNLIQTKLEAKKRAEEHLQDDAIKCLVNEINELKAKKYASGLLERIQKRVDYLNNVEVYGRAIKYTATNKLTSKIRMLGDELITDDYIRRFNEELLHLTNGNIKAKLIQGKAVKGRVQYKIVLEGLVDTKSNPSDILSEGERRVVSLAAFFAEASGRTVSCPLIFDDPISSLDQKYETLVIKRLVEAAENRQVIVFTHRLSMVVGIEDECPPTIKIRGVDLLSNPSIKGVPSESANISGKITKKLNNLKNETLSRARKMDEFSDEYKSTVHYICQQIRIFVEKSIEDTLLNGIVIRYRKSIQTLNKMSWLSQINPNDCSFVEHMMTKYSYYDHAMADETPLQEFTLDEIERDIDSIVTWLDEIKKRQGSK
ncbi:RecF/RecN/SMC N terminal domain-containing protein [Ruminococcaceae bacterium KH2T8]|nr:RecF/RecN/SMC N terminal domain-containing protein [Ruminococcaceae bacterium KH2T8]